MGDYVVIAVHLKILLYNLKANNGEMYKIDKNFKIV